VFLLANEARSGWHPPDHPCNDTHRACVTLLAALDVHPRVAMHILRHAQIDVSMNVYTEVSDQKTLKAVKGLGKQLDS
jgi:hypothetical protein